MPSPARARTHVPRAYRRGAFERASAPPPLIDISLFSSLPDTLSGYAFRRLPLSPILPLRHATLFTTPLRHAGY